MAPNLPWDLIVDILCRMPVKDLLRFRGVAKPWRSLIDDPGFIKKHLKKSVETYSGLGLILKGDGADLSLVSSVDTCGPAQRLDHPLMDGGRFKLMGCCNGLLALWRENAGDPSQLAPSSTLSIEEIVIWNPSTRRYFKVPAPPRSPNKQNSSVIGFGFDSVNQDYKLLMSIDNGGSFIRLESFPIELMVFSFKNNIWTTTVELSDEQIGMDRYCCCVYRDNALHWIAIRKIINSIVAYDLITQQCRDISLPDSKIKRMQLVDLGDGLGVVGFIRKQKDLSSVVGVKVWVMQDCSLDNSWTELFEIAFPSPMQALFRVGHTGPIVQRVSRNWFLFDINGSEFIVYDIERAMLKIVTFSGALKWLEARFCVRSLFGFEGGGGAGAEEGERAGENPEVGAGENPKVGAGENPEERAGENPEVGAGENPELGAGENPEPGPGEGEGALAVL